MLNFVIDKMKVRPFIFGRYFWLQLECENERLAPSLTLRYHWTYDQ